LLRTVFARTLKPGVTYEQFKDAWVPEQTAGDYPATVRIARNVANDRQVITILELDVPVSEFESASAALTRPDALQRLDEIVQATDLEGLYEDVFDETSL
jgi:hypothetical protein